MKQSKVLRAHSTFYVVLGIILLVCSNGIIYMALLSLFSFHIAVCYSDEADMAKIIDDKLNEPTTNNDLYEHSNY